MVYTVGLSDSMHAPKLVIACYSITPTVMSATQHTACSHITLFTCINTQSTTVGLLPERFYMFYSNSRHGQSRRAVLATMFIVSGFPTFKGQQPSDLQTLLVTFLIICISSHQPNYGPPSLTPQHQLNIDIIRTFVIQF